MSTPRQPTSMSRLAALLCMAILLPALSAHAGLVAYFPFDGHTEDDEGIHDGDYLVGGVPAAPVFTEGFDTTVPGALLLDGSGLVLLDALAGDGLPLTANLQFSVAMWVKGGPQPDFRVFSESTDLDNNPLFNIGTANDGATGQLDQFIRNGATIVGHRKSQQEPFDDAWHHIAWTTGEDGTTVVYIDGLRDPVDFSYPRQSWNHKFTTIGGILRAAQSHGFIGALDEVRLYDHVLSLEEVLELARRDDEPCPEQGDTDCGSITVDGPDDNSPGFYTVTALDPVDDSGDTPIFTFRAERAGADPIEIGPLLANSQVFSLDAGTWTITVTVDDSIFCDDATGSNFCEATVVVEAPEPQMLSHWTFDGHTEDEVGDNDGEFYDAGLISDATYVEGRDGEPDGAIRFDGIDDIVVMQFRPERPLTVRPAFSVALWAKGDGTVGAANADDRVFSEGNTQGQNAPLFNLGTHVGGTNPTLDVFIRSNAGTLVGHVNSAEPVFDDRWHHMTYVDVAGEVTVYIDGVLDPALSIQYQRPAPADFPVDTITVGAIRRGADCCFFTGDIDDVRIFNYALSAEEAFDLARPECDAVVRVSRTFTPEQASPGDTVEVRLAVTGVTGPTTVSDTIPERLSFGELNGGEVVDRTITWSLNADGEVMYTVTLDDALCPRRDQVFRGSVTPEGCGDFSGGNRIDCVSLPCESDGGSATLVRAFHFGMRTVDCSPVGDPGTPYTSVLHVAMDPASIAYDAARGWGYEVLYPDALASPYGERDGFGIFGPFDESPNPRDQFAVECPEQLYNSDIECKSWLTVCDENIVTPPDRNAPCDQGELDETPEGVIFRVDVPDGRYRFVAAVGDALFPHAHRLVAENGGDGPPEEIGGDQVVLVDNFNQGDFPFGESPGGNGSGAGVYAAVGFGDHLPPSGDGIAPDPQFVSMDQDGLATEDCPSSPTLEVTEGYVRFHQLQANSNAAPGGNNPDGASLVVLELWSVEEGPGGFRRGDTDASGVVDISDPIFNLQVQFVGGGAAFSCHDAADVDDSGVIDISDPIYSLQYQFVGGIAPPPAPGPTNCGSDPSADGLGCESYPQARC